MTVGATHKIAGEKLGILLQSHLSPPAAPVSVIHIIFVVPQACEGYVSLLTQPQTVTAFTTANKKYTVQAEGNALEFELPNHFVVFIP